LLRDGIHIQVDANVAFQKPIGFLIIDNAENGACVSQTRIEIELGANSESKFVEFHTSTGDTEHYANGIIDLTLGDGAITNIVRVQDRHLKHSQTTRFSAALDRDSRLNYCGFDLGGRLIRNDLHVDIVGGGAFATFDGLYLAGEGQHIDNHTRVDHRVGPAVSVQEYRGILTGKCQCIWNGKAIVHAGADGTDARQQNHNLLLSEKSEIDAKPELEIYADDVKCSHGTTVGQLDESAIFYLRSRGLSEPFAKQVLTRAFAGSIVNKSPIPEIHQSIAEMVEKRLSDIIDLDSA
jgi:Fe-S cluster assembly protein SufD